MPTDSNHARGNDKGDGGRGDGNNNNNNNNSNQGNGNNNRGNDNNQGNGNNERNLQRGSGGGGGGSGGGGRPLTSEGRPVPGSLYDYNITSEPWLSYEFSECQWFSTATLRGVDACNNETQVLTFLGIMQNNLQGTLPWQELALLPGLEVSLNSSLLVFADT